MKISFIDDEPEIFPLQYGGKARTIINLAKEFASSNKVERVCILSRTINDPRSRFIWNNIHFKKLEGYETIREIINESDSADILNVHTCSFTVPFLTGRKAAIVNHLHDVILATSDTGSHLDKALGGRWNAVITPSQFASQTLKNISWWSNLNDRIFTIPRGVNKREFYPVLKKIALSKVNNYLKKDIIQNKHYPILFFPHRINAGKGESILLELSEQLIKKYPNTLILATFEKDTKDTKVSTPIFYNTGWITTNYLKYFYSLSDIVISMSLLPESFSQACLEAVACGTPVSCFKFGNLANLSNKIPAIKSCEPSKESVLNNIVMILENKGKIKEDIYMSKRIIKNNFDLGNISQIYLNLYEKLIKNKENTEYKFIDNLSSKEPMLFVSPLLAIYSKKVYLCIDNHLQSFKISAEERKILDFCQKQKTYSEVLIYTSLQPSRAKKIINRLIKNNLILKG